MLGLIGALVMIRRVSACAIPIQVLVEPLAVVLADAVDPDRPEQAQIFVEQAKLHRGVAQRRLRSPVERRGSRPARSARPVDPATPGKSSGAARPEARSPAGRPPGRESAE